MALLSKTPLDERVKAIRSEIDAIVDARVQELRKQYALPETWLRGDLMGHTACQCEAYFKIKSADDEAAARATAQKETA